MSIPKCWVTVIYLPPYGDGQAKQRAERRKMRLKPSSCLHGLVLLVLLLRLFVSAEAQQARRTRTDPTEAAALNAVLANLGQTASPGWKWNVSGDPCSDTATNDISIFDNPDTRIVSVNPNYNPQFTCNTDQNNISHITELTIYESNAVGPIPKELRNLRHLTDLNLGRNYLTGPLPSFLGELTALQHLSLSINALSGSVPKELGNLTNLRFLGLSTNSFDGTLPAELGNLTKLEELYINSCGLSGYLPSSFSKLSRMKKIWAFDNYFTGRIPDYIGSWSHLEDLRFQGNSFHGPIPATLSKLIRLTYLQIGDIVNGSSSMEFISNMTSLNTLILRNCRMSGSLASIYFSVFPNLNLVDLSFNDITGYVPEGLLDLNSLKFLFLGNNNLSGIFPKNIRPSLNLDLSYNQFFGTFPSSFDPRYVRWNLVGNYFMVDSSTSSSSSVPPGLDCLQKGTPCVSYSQSSSFAVNCGSTRSIEGSDSSIYSRDDAKIENASYYVTEERTWGVSNVGQFMKASKGTEILYTSLQFHNTTKPELFQTARMSPSSLRYFGIGLENGNYTVTLKFAEMDIEDSQTWKSVGRRVFNIYVQGERKEQDFDIKKAAGGKSYTAVEKQYIVHVTRNFLEIHLFWAGKGTCCIPTNGYYGPAISALSATPNFKPTVRNAAQMKRASKTGVTVGVVVGAAVLGLVVLSGLYVWRQKSRKLSLDKRELYSFVGRPNVFSYSYGELRTASETFNSTNLLGEGGYGSVYKGKLTDGSMVAIKQLSETSRQGKKQFIAEIETISQVQHRNLVKLYGCCLEGENPLLVYEYLENGSLDKALFGSGRLNLDWLTRFEICLGVARGLAYLHEESSIRVVHRDIKASNILLDTNFNPKISDFGLAKLYDDKKTHVSTKVAGTFGYLAPEYAMRGHVTEKVDVFAFGVVILEIVAGRPNYDVRVDEEKAYLFEWIWQLYKDGHPLDIADPRLLEFSSDEMLRAIRVGLLCIQSSPRERPSMSRVVAMLAGDMEVPEAVTKPSYISEWQSRPAPTEVAMSAPPSLSSVIEEGR